MPVLVAAKCNNCDFKADLWVDRDKKGYPTLLGITCQSCGKKDRYMRDIQNEVAHALIPPVEDGNINRFEYSFTDENGKKYNKKLDPVTVNKHFQNNQKGN